MKTVILNSVKFLVIALSVVICFLLLITAYYWAMNYNPSSPPEWGDIFSHFPEWIKVAALPGTAISMCFFLIIMKKKYRPVSLGISILMGYSQLIILFLLGILISTSANPLTIQKNPVLQNKFVNEEDYHLYAQEVKESHIKNLVVVLKDSSYPQIIYHPEAKINPESMIVTAEKGDTFFLTEENTLYKRFFIIPDFIKSIQKEFMALTSFYTKTFNRSIWIFISATIPFLLLFVSLVFFAELTRWSLLNFLLLMPASRLVLFLIYHLNFTLFPFIQESSQHPLIQFIPSILIFTLAALLLGLYFIMLYIRKLKQEI